jgi:sugar lactone lactonase YvrE
MIRNATLLVALALLAGCTGRSDLVPPNSSAPNAEHRVAATLRIRIPKAARHVRVVRDGRPRYVSAATKGMTLDITGPTHVSETVGLTPTSTGCRSSVTDTSCTLTLALAPCPSSASCYTATIATYDDVSCISGCRIPVGANELSTAQNVAFGITAGLNNEILLTLSGIPAQLVLVPLSIFTTVGNDGDPPTTILRDVQVIGLGPHQLLVQALDADNNIIVGAGSPTYSVTQTAGPPNFTIAAPTVTSPNTFTLTPPATFAAGTAQLTVKASYAGQPTDGCAPPSAKCSLTVNAKMLQMLAVANVTGGCCGTGALTLYALGDAQPLATLENDVDLPNAVAADPSGNVYVGNGNSSVIEFPAGTAVVGGSMNLSPSGLNVTSLTTDSSGDLFVGLGGAGSAVDEFAPQASSPSRVITAGLDDPVALACDANGRLYVVNQSGQSVTEYDPGSTTAAVTINGFGLPVGLAVGSGATPDLYVADQGGTALWRFPYNSDVSNGDVGGAQGASAPISAVLDDAGNVYAGNTTPFDTIGKWPATAAWPVAATATYATGIDEPVSLLIDANGNLVVANRVASTVEAFPAGSTVPSLTLTNGIATPSSIAIVP